MNFKKQEGAKEREMLKLKKEQQSQGKQEAGDQPQGMVGPQASRHLSGSEGGTKVKILGLGKQHMGEQDMELGRSRLQLLLLQVTIPGTHYAPGCLPSFLSVFRASRQETQSHRHVSPPACHPCIHSACHRASQIVVLYEHLGNE